MPDARDTRTKRQKIEDMARLGTPAEQAVAKRALARIKSRNPMGAPPHERPPVVEIRFGNGESVRVQSIRVDVNGDVHARRWSMPPPSGEEWTPERAAEDAAIWKAAFERMDEAVREQTEKMRAYQDAVRKFAEEVQRAQARRDGSSAPPPDRPPHVGGADERP